MSQDYCVIRGVRYPISWASPRPSPSSTGSATDIRCAITLYEWPASEGWPRHFAAVVKRTRLGMTRETDVSALLNHLKSIRGVNVRRITKQWSERNLRTLGDVIDALPTIQKETLGIGHSSIHAMRQFLEECRLITPEP